MLMLARYVCRAAAADAASSCRLLYATLTLRHCRFRLSRSAALYAPMRERDGENKASDA